ncbi:MAG: hypothetical protein R3A79_03965 [Nannocystaceae bacterium]
MAAAVTVAPLLFAVACSGAADHRCGHVCPVEGILAGASVVYGVASVDAFFGAVLDVKAASERTSAALRWELDAIAVSLGVAPGSSGATIQAAIAERVEAATSGGLHLRHQPAACSTSLEVAAAAAAECDDELDAGDLTVRCDGTCDIDASVQAACAADGALTCVGVAPGLQCAGDCTGTCELSEPSACDGVCRGECAGDCSVVDAQGACAGACAGDCTGRCELAAGGVCDGACQGECLTTPPAQSCDAGVQARCEATASAGIDCSGGCEGAAQAVVNAGCEATVAAKAEANVECRPPEVVITWQWSDALEDDPAGQAEFRAWIGVVRGRLAALLATDAKARVLAQSATSLRAAAEGAVKDSFAALTQTDDLTAAIGAGCGLAQLGDVRAVLEQAGASLEESLSASTEVLVAVGG